MAGKQGDEGIRLAPSHSAQTGKYTADHLACRPASEPAFYPIAVRRQKKTAAAEPAPLAPPRSARAQSLPPDFPVHRDWLWPPAPQSAERQSRPRRNPSSPLAALQGLSHAHPYNGSYPIPSSPPQGPHGSSLVRCSWPEASATMQAEHRMPQNFASAPRATSPAGNLIASPAPSLVLLNLP